MAPPSRALRGLAVAALVASALPGGCGGAPPVGAQSSVATGTPRELPGDAAAAPEEALVLDELTVALRRRPAAPPPDDDRDAVAKNPVGKGAELKEEAKSGAGGLPKPEGQPPAENKPPPSLEQPPGPSAGATTLGATTSAMPFDSESVQKIVRGGLPAVRDCFEKGTPDETAASKLSLSFSIRAKRGDTTDVEVQGEIDETVRECIQSVVKAWTFPPPESKTRVSMPLKIQLEGG